MQSRETLSQQVYHRIKEDILNGVYAEGKLPPESELAKALFVSRITTKSAMKRLVDEGLIVRIRGKGSFVASTASQICASTAPAPKPGNLIALVMGGYTSAFGLDILNGALLEARRHGLHLIVCSTSNDQAQEADTLQSLMAAGVQGIIIQPVHGEVYSRPLIEAVYADYPIVMLDRRMQGINAPFVGVDNCTLSKFAVQKLLAAGHRDIALLALTDQRSSTIEERMSGFVDAYMEKRLGVNKDLWLTNMSDVFDQPSDTLNAAETHERYVSMIQDHLRAHPEITAIFGTEYRVSKAAWDALRRMGKRVPHEVSLVSFDMDSSYVGSHTMSYIKQPQEEMGRRSVQLLTDILAHKPIAERCCLLEGRWVDGGTIAPQPEDVDESPATYESEV